jgi:hypothetical protein
VNNNTWDFQRQSAISPWSMTIGKWFGSTLFTWYGALLCLLFYSLLSLTSTSNHAILALQLGVLVIGGLFSQALALLFSLQILPQIRHEHSNKTFHYFISASVICMIATSLCYRSLTSTAQISWHHQSFSQNVFLLISLFIFLGWAIVGLYRSFSKELQYQNIPWLWFLFNLFCMIYFSGFASFGSIPLATNTINIADIELLLKQTPYYLAFTVITLLTYLGLFSDTLNTIRYKRLFARFHENNLIETLQQLPWWSISFALAIVVGVLANVTQGQFDSTLKDISPGFFILTSLLFLLRDILLAHYFFFSKNPKRAQSTALLYLALLWIVIPLMLETLHIGHLLPALLPSWGQNNALALISVLTQIAFMSLLLRIKWQNIWKNV